MLIVKDASGNIIGTWNNDGIQINRGIINIKNASSATYYTIINSEYPLDIKTSYQGVASNNRFRVGNGYCVLESLDYTGGDNGRKVLLQPESINIYGYDSSASYQISLNPDTIMLFKNSRFYLEIFDTGTKFYHEVNVYSNLYVSGTKSRIVTTDQYSDRLLYCYETPTPMFGDIGDGVISEDGFCYVMLDAVFAQTVTTDQYQVFLQKYGPGDCWVKERKGAYFIVEGTPGMSFGWEVKAKQRDYDQLRLERNDEKFTVPTDRKSTR